MINNCYPSQNLVSLNLKTSFYISLKISLYVNQYWPYQFLGKARHKLFTSGKYEWDWIKAWKALGLMYPALRMNGFCYHEETVYWNLWDLITSISGVWISSQISDLSHRYTVISIRTMFYRSLVPDFMCAYCHAFMWCLNRKF